MPVKIEFETCNAAFCGGVGEIVNILRDIADALAEHGCPPEHGQPQLIFDENGNRVGTWRATVDAEQEGGR